MKILVCVKVIKGEINPFDESALECALRLSDDVTVISMGPENCKDVLAPLTRLGAKVILISDKVFAGSDTLATSYILSTAIKGMEFDLILCGRQSIDGDTAQVGAMLSKMLNVSLITNALTVESDGEKVYSDCRTGKEEAPLPALVTVERGYVLRFPSIFSKAGHVTVLDNSSLNCDVSRCGLEGSPTRVVEAFENQRGRRNCQFINNDELFPLIDKLLKEDRHISSIEPSGEKLSLAWAIGSRVYDKAAQIAKEVVLIDTIAPEEIAKKALEENPEAIIWNADWWGRKNAPVAAAILNTGLCADCTMLEVENETLYMY